MSSDFPVPPNTFCSNHANRPATLVCTQHPCAETPLCDECKKQHELFHTKKKFESLDRHVASCIEVRARVEKQLAEFRIVLGKVAGKLSPEEVGGLRDKLEAIEEIVSKISCVFGRIDKRKKVYSGEAKPDPEEMKENFAVTQSKLEHNFIKIYQDWNQVLGTRFFQLLPETKNFSSVLMYLELQSVSLVVVNSQVGISKSIELKEYGVKSCRTFSVLGGPSLQRFDNKVFLIGGFERTGGASDVMVELEFSDEKFTVRNLPKMIHARYDVGGAVVKKSFIYAVTGTTYPAGQEIHVKYNERYDIAAEKWVSLSQVNVARAIPGICAINDRYIYIYGGQMDSNVSGSALEVYDTLDDERGWKIIKVLDQAAKEVDIGACVTALQTQISDSEYILAHGNASFVMSAVGESVGVKAKPNFELNHSIFYRPVWLEGHRLHFVVGRSSGKNMYNLLTREFSELAY